MIEEVVHSYGISKSEYVDIPLHDRSDELRLLLSLRVNKVIDPRLKYRGPEIAQAVCEGIGVGCAIYYVNDGLIREVPHIGSDFFRIADIRHCICFHTFFLKRFFSFGVDSHHISLIERFNEIWPDGIWYLL